jgi:hypothetical protein
MELVMKTYSIISQHGNFSGDFNSKLWTEAIFKLTSGNKFYAKLVMIIGLDY